LFDVDAIRNVAATSIAPIKYIWFMFVIPLFHYSLVKDIDLVVIDCLNSKKQSLDFLLVEELA